jgi:hypothetical protein
MNTKAAGIVGGCLLVSALLFTLVPHRCSSSSKLSEKIAYQLVLDESYAFRFNTQTGRLWLWTKGSSLNGQPQWFEQQIPGLDPKAKTSSPEASFQLILDKDYVFLLESQRGRLWLWTKGSSLNGQPQWFEQQIPGLDPKAKTSSPEASFQLILDKDYVFLSESQRGWLWLWAKGSSRNGQPQWYKQEIPD